MCHHHQVVLPLLQPYYHTIVEKVSKAVNFLLGNPTTSIPTKNYLFLVLQEVTKNKKDNLIF